jgi:hypothetical protein
VAAPAAPDEETPPPVPAPSGEPTRLQEETRDRAPVIPEPAPSGAATAVPHAPQPSEPVPIDAAPSPQEPETEPTGLLPAGVALSDPTVIIEGLPILDVSAFDAPAGRGFRILQLVGTSDTLTLTVVPLDPSTASQAGGGRVRVRESEGSSIGTTRFDHYLVTGKAALPATEIEALLHQLVEVLPP